MLIFIGFEEDQKQKDRHLFFAVGVRIRLFSSPMSLYVGLVFASAA